MKSFKVIFITLFLIVSFSACSSGKSSDRTSTQESLVISFSGIVADGLLSGATVCLDLDVDGYCNGSDPQVATSSSGVFSFSNITTYKSSFIPVISRSGIDTATGKKFVGELKNILYIADLDTNKYQYITPLTDLVATNFLNSSIRNTTVLKRSREMVSRAYTISTDYIDQSPLAYAGIFARTQEIQQTLGLLEAAVAKAKNVSLTTVENEAVREDIKKALLTQINKTEVLDLAATLTELETIVGVTFSDSEKSFLELQLREIKLSIDDFVGYSNLTELNLNNYQVALEDKAENVYALMQTSDANSSIATLPIDINITAILYPPSDENVTIPDNNATEPDNNTTQPAESNTTVISLNGYIVDGYISGASVCMDTNYDGICGASEPFDVSLETGAFSFESIEVNKDTMIPIISVNGKDTSTFKTYDGELKNVIYSSSSSLGSDIFITPLTDLVTTNFLFLGDNSATAYSRVLEKMSQAFGFSNDLMTSNPMSSVKLFISSLELEHIKRIIEKAIVKKNTQYASSKKKELQRKIKEVVAIQSLETTFENLDISRILVTLEIDLGLVIPSDDQDFVINQIAEIRAELEPLVSDTNINTYALPRIQNILESDLENAYANVLFNDVNLSTERITNSEFDTVDASYDSYACSSNETYTNTLSDSNSTSGRSEDKQFGLSVHSDASEVKLFYPNLVETKTSNDVIIFEDAYYFSFDEAWVAQNGVIYIQTPKDENGKFGCFKATLNSTTAGDIAVIKVFRYTDL